MKKLAPLWVSFLLPDKNIVFLFFHRQFFLVIVADYLCLDYAVLFYYCQYDKISSKDI